MKNFLFVLLSLICFFPLPAKAFSGGDGSAENPYQISNSDDWAELARMTKNDAMSTFGKYFILTKDLTVEYGVGNETNSFYGTFDGDNHTVVANIKLDRSSYYTGGIFGSINNGTVKNLKGKGIISVYSIEQQLYVGGICAKSTSGRFYNCENNVYIDFSNQRYNGMRYVGGICGYAISGSEFKDCRNIASVRTANTSHTSYSGGVAGYSEGSIISNCWNEGAVAGSTQQSTYQPDEIYAGGIVGYSESDIITNCFNTATVKAVFATDLTYSVYTGGCAGGIVGYNNMTQIYKCYNSGNIAASYTGRFTNRYSPNAGGIYGRARDITAVAKDCFVTDCAVSVTTDGNIGLIGVGGKAENCYVSDNAIESRGSGAVSYRVYETCRSADLRTESWLNTALSWDFTDNWFIGQDGVLPLLKMIPDVKIADTGWVYGEIATDFIKTSNNSSPITLESNNGFKIIENTCVPVKAGNAHLKVSQGTSGKWKKYEKEFYVEVAKRNLIVSAPNVSVSYGLPLPDVRMEYDGFAFDDTEDSLSKLPAYTCDAYENCDAGKYPVTPYGGKSDNYSFTYVPGMITITPAEQVIKWNQDFDSCLTGTELELTAVSSSGLPIEYESSDEDKVSVINRSGKSYVKFMKVGDVSLTAHLNGNHNFLKGESVSMPLSVKTSVTSLTLDKTEIFIYENCSEKLQAFMTSSEGVGLIWSSSDENIATVAQDGEVTGVSHGKAVISVCPTDGSDLKASCEVLVDEESEFLSIIDDKEVSITIKDKVIEIIGCSSESMVSISDYTGSEIYYGKEKIIEMPAPGLYMIRIDGKTIKILI